jgi:hypothetical protein
MTMPRASKEQDSSEIGAKKGFFSKILNKVSTKKPLAVHKPSGSIHSEKSSSSKKEAAAKKSSTKVPNTARNQ